MVDVCTCGGVRAGFVLCQALVLAIMSAPALIHEESLALSMAGREFVAQTLLDVMLA